MLRGRNYSELLPPSDAKVSLTWMCPRECYFLFLSLREKRRWKKEKEAGETLVFVYYYLMMSFSVFLVLFFNLK